MYSKEFVYQVALQHSTQIVHPQCHVCRVMILAMSVKELGTANAQIAAIPMLGLL